MYAVSFFRRIAPIVAAVVATLTILSNSINAQSGPCLEVFPDTLYFSGNACDTTVTPIGPDTSGFVVNNCGGDSLFWDVDSDSAWVKFSHSSGLNHDTVAVWIDWNSLWVPALTPGDSMIYYAWITVSAPDAPDSVKGVVVKLTMHCPEPGQRLVVTPLSFNFTMPTADTLTDVFHVADSAGDTTMFSYANTTSWLVLPLTFAPVYTPDSVRFMVHSAGLSPGNYFDTITVFGWGPDTSSLVSEVIIPVSLTITSSGGGGDTLVAEPASFDYSLNPGDSIIGDSLHLFTRSGNSVSFWMYHLEPWLELDTLAAVPLVTPKTIKLNVRTAGLPPGIYSDTIFVIGNSVVNSLLKVPVVLRIDSGGGFTDTLVAVPRSYSYTLTAGDSVIGDSVHVFTTSAASVNFWTHNMSSWLYVDTIAASPLFTPKTFVIHVRTAGLTPGGYGDTIIIWADSVHNSPIVVPVYLHVAPDSSEYVVMTSPTSFDLALEKGSTYSDSLNIFEHLGRNVGFAFSNSQPWLTTEPFPMPPFVTPWSMTVLVNTSALDVGHYVDTIMIWPTDSPAFALIAVPVNLEVTDETVDIRTWPRSFDFVLFNRLDNMRLFVFEQSSKGVVFDVKTNPGSTWLRVHPPDSAGWVTSTEVLFDIVEDTIPAGAFSDTIVIYNPLDDGSPYFEIKVPVVIRTGPGWGTLAASPNSISRTRVVGDTTWHSPDSLYIYEIHGYTASFSVSNSSSWLHIDTGFGGQPLLTGNSILVHHDLTGLAAGTYVDTILVHAPPIANSPLAIPYTLHVVPDTSGGGHHVTVSDSLVDWLVPLGGGEMDSVDVREALGRKIPFRFSWSASWLTVMSVGLPSPNWGITPQTMHLFGDATGLSAGNYSATVTIFPDSGGVWFTPVPFEVSMVVSSDTSVTFICGDIDGNDQGPDVSDLTYLVSYMFQGGPPPPNIKAAMIAGPTEINISTLTYLVAYMFLGGSGLICP